MAYKLGLMLSMVFLMAVMLLGGDIIAVSSIHSSLDALALVVSRNIGKEGCVSENTLFLVQEHQATLEYEELHFPHSDKAVPSQVQPVQAAVSYLLLSAYLNCKATYQTNS